MHILRQFTGKNCFKILAVTISKIWCSKSCFLPHATDWGAILFFHRLDRENKIFTTVIYQSYTNSPLKTTKSYKKFNFSPDSLLRNAEVFFTATQFLHFFGPNVDPYYLWTIHPFAWTNTFVSSVCASL